MLNVNTHMYRRDMSTCHQWLRYASLQLACRKGCSCSGKPRCTETPSMNSLVAASVKTLSSVVVKTDLIAISKLTPAVRVCLLEEGAVVTN